MLLAQKYQNMALKGEIKKPQIIVLFTIAIVLIILVISVFYLPSKSLQVQKIAVLLSSERKNITPCFYQGFNTPLKYDFSISPIRISIKGTFIEVTTMPNIDSYCQIDTTYFYKDQGSLKIDGQYNGIGVLIKDFNSADISISLTASCKDGKEGNIKIGMMEVMSDGKGNATWFKDSKEVGYIWHRVIFSQHYQKNLKDVYVMIINNSDGSLWIDELKVRKEIVSNEEIITGKTLSVLDDLNINYEILSDEEIKKDRLEGFNALVIPYYTSSLKQICSGNYSPNPVYIIYYEPMGEMPYNGVIKTNEQVEYAYFEKEGYAFPFFGRFQTIDLKDMSIQPLLWNSQDHSKAISWRYKNVIWNSFPANYISYIYILGRLAQDLNLIVSPYVFVLDINDINTPSVSPEEISKIADFLREQKWSTHLGIKPEYLNYLEPEFIQKSQQDTEIKKKLDLEKRQVETILKNTDVFIPVVHAHSDNQWKAISEKEQSESYTKFLRKMRTYGFQISENSFGYMYFPNNTFNESTVNYLTRTGVHIFRVCFETYPEFENRYYQKGDLSIIPSVCPIHAGLTSVSLTGENEIEYFARTRWYFFDLVSNKKVAIIHGDNFADGALGYRVLANTTSLIKGSKIAIYGTPFDLRDKYAYPFRILSQQKGADKVILTFDRELSGQKLISTTLPLKRVINEQNEDIILSDPHIFYGVGRKLTLYYNTTEGEQIPGLNKVSNNAFLRYALYKNGKVTLEFEGYGDTGVSLVNLRKSTGYLITNKCLQPPDKNPPSFIQTTSNKGELNFRLTISSYNSVSLIPEK